jgi:PAS domain S-box-containing protein
MVSHGAMKDPAEAISEAMPTESPEMLALRAALQRERDARVAAEQLLERERARRVPTYARPSEHEVAGSTATGFWEREVESGEVVWSDGLYALLGYAPGAVPPSAANFAARVHPDDRTAVPGGPGERSDDREFRVVLADGEVRWMRSMIQQEPERPGRPARQVGVVVDITAARLTEVHHARLADVARRTTNSVIVTDAGGRIEWVNEGFTRLTGFGLDEVRGRQPGQLLQGPETSPEVRAVMHRAVAAGLPFDEVALNYTRSGRQYWVQLETRPLHDARGRLTGFTAVQTDVTERRIAASRESLAQRVAAHLLVSDSLEAAGERVVRELVRELDVRAAQLWSVDPRQATLRYCAGASADAAAEDWVAATRDLTFRRGRDWIVGVGAPGTAWGTAATYVRSDFWTDDSNGHPSRRAFGARKAGIRTVCAVPIIGPDGVLAVLEVGGSHSYPGYDRLPSLLERIAEQLASFILQQNSRRAFEAMFRSSPDALLLVDADGVVRATNTRASLMFGAVEGQPADALLDDAAALVAETLAAGEAASSTALLIQRGARRADGATFSAELTIAATPSSTEQSAIIAVRDLTERHRLEAALTSSLREKEILVQEVHHRVKNNLQIISSMVSLQSDALVGDGARAALLDTANRVRSMALVHQQLYANDDISQIDFGDYTRSLAQSLCQLLDPQADLAVAVEPVDITVALAVPAGLVLNELVTNALKHGRSADGRCRLRVDVQKTAAGFAFTVSDHGPGGDQKPKPGTSVGQTLIRALVRQLRARMTVTCEGGRTVHVEVPRA